MSGYNLGYIDRLHALYRQNPLAVEPSWREYFEANGPEVVGSESPSEPSGQLSTPPRPRPAAPARPRPPVDAAVAAERVRFLQSVELFASLDPDELADMAALADEVVFEDGTEIFRRGEPGSDLYVIEEGVVLIMRHDQVIAELEPGEVVGEMAVLDDAPRSADGRAHGRVTLLRIHGADLVARIDADPHLARAIMRNLVGRLRDKDTKQDVVDQLIRAYRVRGHLLADVNPLHPPRQSFPELELEHYRLGEADLDSYFSTSTIAGTVIMTLRQIVERLRQTYCGAIGVQYMHIDDPAPRGWLQERMEDPQAHRRLSTEEQRHILAKLTDAQVFEQFVHRKFIGAKRFSLEGAETMIPLLDLAIDEASRRGVDEVVIGMPHRGRLNVLVNVLGKSPLQIFREFDQAEEHVTHGRGDVKYHMGYSSDVETAHSPVHLSLTFNPSHLEFVAPVVQGRVRAKQDARQDWERRQVMGIVLHGDAAFAGQGVVQELLNMSELGGYSTGGTLHIVVNNQIGFTTLPHEGRSTQYATDVTRMLQTPVFHVNGEHPEAVAQVVRWAMAYRERFQKDVIIDMYCYRLYGHNEGDEPAFTQPRLYELIRSRKSVLAGYTESLLELGGITREEAEEIAESRRRALDDALDEARHPDFEPQVAQSGLGVWVGYKGGPDAEVPDVTTGVEKATLSGLLERLASVPERFAVHPKLERVLDARRAMAAGERPLDWAAGEALAFASLLVEGHAVRLSGQDAQRGTFAHRHAVLHDVEIGEPYVSLEHVAERQALFEGLNSPLNETGVLGFEYGYSLDRPSGLTVWEAQFGDFSNVAQVIIDQFITSGEEKWERLSGLVMLLPHGFEGQGPEHSSARLERFLMMAAEDNIQVVNLTTPAQIFHCLRRQVRRPLRKPLVVMSPKSLLRHPEATSGLDELDDGTSFRRVLGDERLTRKGGPTVRRALVCCGKVYYDLLEARAERQADDVAIVRLEQLYPLPRQHLLETLSPLGREVPVWWVQEEPRNMGAWTFLHEQLGDALFETWPLDVVARPERASPATGSSAAHKVEQATLVETALAS